MLKYYFGAKLHIFFRDKYIRTYIFFVSFVLLSKKISIFAGEYESIE